MYTHEHVYTQMNMHVHTSMLVHRYVSGYTAKETHLTLEASAPENLQYTYTLLYTSQERANRGEGWRRGRGRGKMGEREGCRRGRGRGGDRGEGCRGRGQRGRRGRGREGGEGVEMRTRDMLKGMMMKWEKDKKQTQMQSNTSHACTHMHIRTCTYVHAHTYMHIPTRTQHYHIVT